MIFKRLLVRWFEKDIADFVAKRTNCQQVKAEKKTLRVNSTDGSSYL